MSTRSLISREVAGLVVGFARAGVAALLVLSLAGATDAAVPTPGAPESRSIALVGGTLHPIAGDEVPGGTLIMDHGKIAALGQGVAVPADAERIDVTGKHVYPGLIDPYSILGLVEFDEVRASADFTEVGDITPNVKAQVAVNPESEAIPVTRSNGVLTALVAPSGSLLRGTSALMMLDGWTWEEMTLKAPIGLHVRWPALVVKTQGVSADSAEKLRAARAKALQKLQDAFDQARAYWTAKKAGARQGLPSHDSDARWEAMIPVLEGKIPLIVEANEVQQIESAVAFADQQKVHVVIYGGYDAPRCAALLRRFSVAVIVSDIDRLPMHRYDAYDDPFTLPDRLRLAGIRFCIANGGGFWNERNLPYSAAKAAAYGLPRAEALRAITLYPAQILGVADRIGSLEAGKDATLIVTDGDPLEIPTHVERAFIQGRKIDLQDKQKVLWEKYQEKYRRLSSKQPGSGGGRATTSPVKPAR